MNRQYIGARYVPVFADPIEWQPNKNYEGLTIVTYMGSSYTSKKDVPAGANPMDTRYWALTGNYNAQVEVYRQEAVAASEGFNKMFNRKWIFIGDSYDTYSYWVNRTAHMLQLTEDKYWNISVPEHGFANGAWKNDLMQWVNEHPEEVPNIGHIVVGGGLNDSTAQNRSDLEEYIGDFGAYCRRTFDDAVVHVAYFGWELDSNQTLHQSSPEGRADVQWKYSKSGRYYMQYLNGCETAIHARTLMGEDSINPNTQGGFAIAAAVANAIKCGSATTDFPVKTGTFTPANGTSFGFVKQSIVSKNVYTTVNLTLNNPGIVFNSTKVTAVAGDLILPYSNAFPSQNIHARYKTADGAYGYAPVTVNCALNKLNLYFYFDTEAIPLNGITPVQIELDFNCIHNALTD